MIESGRVYILINGKAHDRCLDLSGGDKKSIIGYGINNGDNQKWEFCNENNGWTLRSVATGRYLGIGGSPGDGTPLVATEQKFTWYIFPDEEDNSYHRLFVPNTSFNADLSDHGSETPGTPIQLWGKWNGRNQVWKIVPA